MPFPPGGSTDTIARSIAPKLQEKLGGTFVVENKAGATGTIGAAFVKRAAPDGYTLFVSSLGPYVIAPHLIKGVQYDALHDFDLLTVAVQAPNVLVVPASSPYNSVADVLAALKKTPGKVSFACSACTSPATAPPTTCRPSSSGSRPAPAACTSPTRAAPRR